MKIWSALTEDGQNAVLFVAFLLECYFLFWVMA